MGITRLNVYAGEAAGYVVTDQVDTDLINGTNVSGVNPTCLKVLPPDVFGLGFPSSSRTGPSWTPHDRRAGPDLELGNRDESLHREDHRVQPGDLWYPHVYMSAQNPWDLTGINAFGRWHYGPWFIAADPDVHRHRAPGRVHRGRARCERVLQPVCDGLPDP